MYALTDEQQSIVSTIVSTYADHTPGDPTQYICIEAVAGSSKSYTTVKYVEALQTANDNDLTIYYLVYNKANKLEMANEFGSNAFATTINSLAYRAVVPYLQSKSKGKIQVANFLTWRDVPKSVRIPYGDTYEVLQLLNQYCKSHTYEWRTFALNEVSDEAYNLVQYAKEIFDLMADGTIPRITHAFYLKYYYNVLVHTDYTPEPLDVLIFDEMNDSNQIFYDIFINLPAKLKIALGDAVQDINKWNGTVDALPLVKKQTNCTVLPLSKSFRVAAPIAEKVQSFVRTYIDEDFVFTGMDHPTSTVRTTVILTATNAALIEHMIKYTRMDIPYKLSNKQKLDSMFSMPMFLLSLKPGTEQKTYEHKLIQEDYDKWYNDDHLQAEYPKPLTYLRNLHPENEELSQSISLIITFGPADIIDVVTKARKGLLSPDAHVTIQTAFTSKGATYDKVIISDDLNDKLTDVFERTSHEDYVLQEKDKQLFNLYYVACTRGKYEIENAIHLD